MHTRADKRINHFFFYVFVLFLIQTVSYAQQIPAFEKVIPKITHYTRSDFEADGQFWTMTEDENGKLYFGNNDGILVFDGERWEKVTLPNHSGVRSLIRDSNNTIHAGGFNEIGIVKQDIQGNFNFISQNDSLQLDSENLENLWQVHEFKGNIIYRSFKELTVVNGTNAKRVNSGSNFIFSGIVNDHFYVQDQNLGVFEYNPENSSLTKAFNSTFSEESICAFLPAKNEDELLIITKQGGIYMANRTLNTVRFIKSVFKENDQEEILTAVAYKGIYLLGTLTSKMILMNAELELDRNPSLFKNLSSSTILSINPQEEESRIWVMLNNGIDLIEFDSPVSQIFENASVSDVLVYNNILYLTTNTGVFYAPFDSGNYSLKLLNFKKVLDLEGQAWSVKEHKGSILVGHDKGLFELIDFMPKRIGIPNGIWKVIPVDGKDNTFLATSYSGIYPLYYESGNWRLSQKIKGFDVSSRDILQIDKSNDYWVCHGYKGIYRLKIDKNLERVFALEHFTNTNGLQSAFNVNVTEYEGEVVFTTNTGIYTFNAQQSQFEPYRPLNSILSPELNTRKLMKVADKTWFVQDDEPGYFIEDKGQIKINKSLFLNLKGNLNRGLESILPITTNQVLIGATNGLFLYNLDDQKAKTSSKTLITRLTYQKDPQNMFQLPIIQNLETPLSPDVLRFEFAAPALTPSSQKEFQYKLEGADKEWSSWSANAFKEYTHPAPGDYVFRVRSRNLLGQKADEAAFALSIPYPWYRSTFALILYVLGVTSLIILLTKLINKKIERERLKEKLAAQKSKKLLELEIEQLKLEKDKAQIKRAKEVLEEESLIKSKELANYTMLLVKKKEIFSDTFNALKDFRNSLKTQAARKRLQEVLFNLNQHRMGEEYLHVFDVHFEKVHHNFFNRLKDIDPGISKRELRLCAFVKMNLTNKEIAPLLNISTRGVETARYRIRKKLHVTDESFQVYLETLNDS